MRKSSLDPEILEEVFEFICKHWAQFGYGPSLREIALACYISRPNVYRYLDRLEVEGRIAREPGISRGIILLTVCT